MQSVFWQGNTFRKGQHTHINAFYVQLPASMLDRLLPACKIGIGDLEPLNNHQSAKPCKDVKDVPFCSLLFFFGTADLLT